MLQPMQRGSIVKYDQKKFDQNLSLCQGRVSKIKTKSEFFEKMKENVSKQNFSVSVSIP